MSETNLRLTPHLEPTRACLCFNLRKSARAVTQFYDEALRPTALRTTQFSLLVGMRIMRSTTLNALAEAMGMDRTTLTRNLRPLQRRGLVRVTPGQDRREREVRLSPAGEHALAKALPLWKKVQEKVATELGQDRLIRILKDLSTAAKVTQLK